jgi:hypothetical protein
VSSQNAAPQQVPTVSLWLIESGRRSRSGGVSGGRSTLASSHQIRRLGRVVQGP